MTVSEPPGYGYGDDPVCTVDTLVVTGHAVTDELGREWGMEGGQDKGWITSAAPRARREARPSGHGSFRSAAYRDGLQFSLGGYVSCPTPGLRERTERELAALCNDPARLYEFRRRTATYDQTRMVELNDAPQIEMVSIVTLRWLFTFFAPDPRAHDGLWQEPVCGPPRPTTLGLDFGGAGLDFGGAGLNFGTPGADSTVAQVANYGTAPAHPLFRLQGPLSEPAILHRESGRALRYAGSLAAGETVWINAGEFAARDTPAHAVLSSTRGNVATLLVREGRDWPQVDPQEVATFTLRGFGDPTASLSVLLRSAWW